MQRKALGGVVALILAISMPAGADDSYTARDIRQPIPVTAKERNQFLFEMRELLHGLFNLHLALSKNDFQAAAVAARPIGHLIEKTPASLRDRLPEEYVQIGIAMQESFDLLARIAEERKDMPAVQAQLAESMTYCSGCHDAYRFDVRAVIPGRK